MTSIPADVMSSQEALDTHLTQLGVGEVMKLVESGHLAIERISDPLMRQQAVREHQRRQADQAVNDAFARLPEGLGIASYVATVDEPHAVITYLVSEGIVEPPEDYPDDEDWAPKWDYSDGYIFVEGVSSEELEWAILAVRARD